MKNRIVALALAFAASVLSATAQNKTENIVLITLDGFRWQELFNGAEARLITKEFVSDSAKMMKTFWADTPIVRREKLMPFFWTTIGTKGQVFGNRAYGNFVNVSNNQWFSYPGYSELLCGVADNERIHSNDKINNPNTTVLEFINAQKGFKGKVAAFASWDVFPYIINTQRSGIPVNAGLVRAEGSINDKERWLNEMMFQVPNPLGDIRLDAFTFNYAFEYFKKNKPRVLYIAFDETDDFAHGGKYDLYLHSARYTDQFIETLWNWCQQDARYKDKTTFIITCDHGRGYVEKSDWKHHGQKTANSDEIWFAVIGPDTKPLGEMKKAGQWYQNQLAKTLAGFLGLTYEHEKKAGAPVVEVSSVEK